MHIEDVTARSLPDILPLIAAYQRFYETSPDDGRNLTYFGAIIEDPTQCRAFVARNAQRAAIGFATLYFPFSTVAAGRTCLLNDLYVTEDARGSGAGRALIAHCLAVARDLGYHELQWRTRDTNERAQQLYDSLPATRTVWFTYRLPVTSTGES